MQNSRNQHSLWNVKPLAVWSVLTGMLGMMGFHGVSLAADPFSTSVTTAILSQDEDPFAESASEDSSADAKETDNAKGDPFANDSADSTPDIPENAASAPSSENTEVDDTNGTSENLDDPFGDGTSKPEASTGTAPAADTVPGTPVVSNATDTAITEAELEAAPVGVRALLLAKPEKPVDLIRIGKLLSDIDASAFGIRLLQRVQAMNLDEAALGQLGETLSPEILLAIGTHPELQPIGKDLAMAIQKAYEKAQQTMSVERIESLFSTLLEDGKNLTPAEAATISQRRTESLLALQRLGDHLVPYLLERLTREREQNVQTSEAIAFRQAALDLITQCGEGSIPVFAAAFDSDREALKLTVLDVLAEVRSSGFTTMTVSATQRGGELFVAGLGSNSAAIREATLKTIRQTGFPTSDLAIMAARFAQTAENYLNTPAEMVFEQPEVESQEMAGVVQPSPQLTIPRTVFWQWDATAQQIVPVMRTASQQRRSWAIRYARAANAIDPKNSSYLELSDITVLENALRTVAEDRLANPGPAATADQTDFESILQTVTSSESSLLSARSVAQLATTADRAMVLRQSPAAMVLLQQLAAMPNAESTLYAESGSSVWVRALAYPDPRLRWVAMESLLRLAPSKPYAQSFLLPQTLAYFANAFGDRKAVVVGFPQKEMEDYRRYLVELGYECETASTGNELMQSSQDLCDVEVIFIAASVNKPTADFLLPQIRRDARLGAVPVAIIAEDFSLNRAGLIAAKYPWTRSFIMPADVDIARSQIEQLLSLTYHAEDAWRPIPVSQRKSLAIRAIRYVGELAVHSNTKEVATTALAASEWDLSIAETPVIQAATSPEMVEAALPYLSERGTAACQQALLRIAESDSYPETVRRTAIAGLDRAISLRTILLTRRELQDQYDRFNATGPKEPANRAIRAAILDTLEKPLAQRKEKRN